MRNANAMGNQHFAKASVEDGWEQLSDGWETGSECWWFRYKLMVSSAALLFALTQPGSWIGEYSLFPCDAGAVENPSWNPWLKRRVG